MQSAVDRRQECVNTAGADLPLDAAVVFPDVDSFLERRACGRRAKLLAALGPTLRAALQPGERIRFAGRGVQYLALEFYFSGALVAQMSNLTALVVTDQRLFLIHVRSNGAPRDVKNQIRLSEIREVKGFWGRFRLKLADGRKLVFVNVPSADRKGLASALPAETPSARAPSGPATTPSVEHLCPICLQPVPGRVGETKVCPNATCRIPFRDPRRAARLSLLLPGVGDMYLRHHLFGSFEFIGSIVTLIVGILLVFSGVVAPDATDAIGMVVLGGFLIIVPHVIDYFVTLHMARKGLVPLADRPSPTGIRNLPAFPPWAYALFILGFMAVAATIVALAAGWR